MYIYLRNIYETKMCQTFVVHFDNNNTVSIAHRDIIEIWSIENRILLYPCSQVQLSDLIV